MTEEAERPAVAEARNEPAAGILKPGRNCWRIAKASRASLLPDAATYFARLEQAFRQAERSILIIGWDFDGRIHLCPEDRVCLPLGPMLRELVETRPDLHVRILVWSLAVVHGPSATTELLINPDWQEHPRITVRLDHEHPIYAAHHQKIVCVDDQVAFVGGIDLTVKRWDTWRHKAGDHRRIDPDGHDYEPVHDMQMIVEGDAARAVAEVAKTRWKRALDEELPPVAAAGTRWPDGLVPHFVDTDVAVARTLPVWRTHPPVHEIGTLTLDAISAAKRCIYIEAQYFANFEVAERLAESLQRPDGPEVVVLMSRVLPGKFEQFIMGRNRDRVLRRLMQADRYKRFGGYHTVSPSPKGDVEILIHAKLLIVDDQFLRVGSANLNNRSVGLDTECDLAIEASTDQQREVIARLRRELLAGHLHVSPDELAETTRRLGSTIAAIRALGKGGTGLHDFTTVKPKGPTGPVFGTGLLDPKEPLSERWWWGGRKKGQPPKLAPS
ncbi:phospholipase D-like domain-containing protein [Geminicoccus roseus]|uniref:phospholipase D-like domain-containing protein n=1 Tax=Geminicoccus roseus TaxID=404900 RepID=UPI000A03A1E7|nr:phospholipase D-like domain-containing protein [Geminicoccus roseus]